MQGFCCINTGKLCSVRLSDLLGVFAPIRGVFESVRSTLAVFKPCASMALIGGCMNDGCFEVQEPNGKVYRVWLNGLTEGFVEGAFVLNRMAPAVNREKHIAWLKGKEAQSIAGLLQVKLNRLLRVFRRVPRLENVCTSLAQPMGKSRE